VKVLDRTEELFNKLLDEHPPELILGALNEMSRMSRNELLALSELCEVINRVEAKNHQPD
jgi:fructose-1-phosphate kinase PfkB-like protein